MKGYNFPICLPVLMKKHFYILDAAHMQVRIKDLAPTLSSFLFHLLWFNQLLGPHLPSHWMERAGWRSAGSLQRLEKNKARAGSFQHCLFIAAAVWGQEAKLHSVTQLCLKQWLVASRRPAETGCPCEGNSPPELYHLIPPTRLHHSYMKNDAFNTESTGCN